MTLLPYNMENEKEWLFSVLRWIYGIFSLFSVFWLFSPAGTQRLNNIESTLFQRCVTAGRVLRGIYAVKKLLEVTSKLAKRII